MNNYITAKAVKNPREKKGLNQAELANPLGVSSKTVSQPQPKKI